MSKYRFVNRITRLGSRYSGQPELHSVYAMEQAEWQYYLATLQNGMIAFDVGANVGLLTTLFSRFVRESGQVHAFEPSADTFNRLKTILDLSHCTNVTLNQAAVADKPGVLKLHTYGEAFSSLNSLANRPLQTYGVPVALAHTEEVTAVTIDGYCQQHGIEQIDLLKIDAEGAEFQVFQGASQMLREKRIAACVFEFGQTWFDMGNDPARVLVYLRACGYRVQNVVRGAGLFPVDSTTGYAKIGMYSATPQ